MAVGSKFSDMNSEGKDLKHWYFVLEGLEKGVEAQLSCELSPLIPGSDGLGGITSSDSCLDCFLSSAEVMAESICSDGVQS